MVAGPATAWLESLSPWPADGFGTERMHALLDLLGNPERSFEAVHVVGTKGKSTAARRIARTIGGPSYTSPHVAGWHERLDTDPAGLERALARVRGPAEELGATQFETVTAAAFADFAARGATAAAIEAGVRGPARPAKRDHARGRPPTQAAPPHPEGAGAGGGLGPPGEPARAGAPAGG